MGKSGTILSLRPPSIELYNLLVYLRWAQRLVYSLTRQNNIVPIILIDRGYNVDKERPWQIL